MRSLRSRKALLGAALVLCSTWIAFAVGSRSSLADDPPPPEGTDPAGDVAPTDPLAEPITGTVVLPEPGDETGPLHPFDPPPRDSSDVPLSALTPEEQAYVQAQSADGWAAVHDGFGAATRQAAERAAAEAAANALGIAGIGDIGVTP